MPILIARVGEYEKDETLRLRNQQRILGQMCVCAVFLILLPRKDVHAHYPDPLKTYIAICCSSVILVLMVLRAKRSLRLTRTMIEDVICVYSSLQSLSLV